MSGAVAQRGAVAGGGAKIGFVDVERITRESVPAELARARLEKAFADRAQELRQSELEISKLREQLEQSNARRSTSDIRQGEQDLSRMMRDLQRLERAYMDDLNARRNQELQSVLERANEAIKQIAESEGFDLIVQDAVYHGSRIDLTDRVLKLLSMRR